jgi:hypothetical protein
MQASIVLWWEVDSEPIDSKPKLSCLEMESGAHLDVDLLRQ